MVNYTILGFLTSLCSGVLNLSETAHTRVSFLSQQKAILTPDETIYRNPSMACQTYVLLLDFRFNLNVVQHVCVLVSVPAH